MFQQYYDAGAEGYDRLFGRVPQHFSAPLLRAARLAPGQHVLEVATGTGLIAEGIANAIGPSGQLIGVDISRAMLARAELRLQEFSNVSLELGNGQALRFRAGEFDAAICSLALMLFPSPARGAAEMYRVVRRGGRIAVSVETEAARSLSTRINAVIGRHVHSRAAAAGTYYSLGQEQLLRPLLENAGFSEVEVFEESHTFPFPSFAAYFQPIEDGAGSVGAEFVALSSDLRHAVKEDIRDQLDPDGSGGPINIHVTMLFATGVR